MPQIASPFPSESTLVPSEHSATLQFPWKTLHHSETLQDIPQAISPSATTQTDDSRAVYDLECANQVSRDKWTQILTVHHCR